MIACIQASLIPRPGFESENEAIGIWKIIETSVKR